jgi:hypothetical protein
MKQGEIKQDKKKRPGNRSEPQRSKVNAGAEAPSRPGPKNRGRERGVKS